MARGLDHIVHAVRDLEAAAALYERFGFQVGARNWLPRSWGAQNHVVQLAGTFVELLTVADASGIASHAPRFFSFGAFNRDFLARWQGLSMLALEGRGGPDAEAFREAGIGDFQLYEFERQGKRPDGTPIKVAFSLAFASDPQAPDVGFFTCQHRHPENFWNPAFQVHANTAAGVAAVVLVAENPTDHHIFLEAFTGVRDIRASSMGLTIATPRGAIQVMDPSSFKQAFGVDAPKDVGLRLAALVFSVADLKTARGLLEKNGVPVREQAGRLVVGPEAALGATIAFLA